MKIMQVAKSVKRIVVAGWWLADGPHHAGQSNKSNLTTIPARFFQPIPSSVALEPGNGRLIKSSVNAFPKSHCQWRCIIFACGITQHVSFGAGIGGGAAVEEEMRPLELGRVTQVWHKLQEKLQHCRQALMMK